MRCASRLPRGQHSPHWGRRSPHYRVRAQPAPVPAQQPAESALEEASEPSGQVTISFRGRQVLARHGSKLRTALLKNNLSPHNPGAQVINCRGLGTCGTCAVAIRCVTAQRRFGLIGQPTPQPCRQARLVRGHTRSLRRNQAVVMHAPPLPHRRQQGGCSRRHSTFTITAVTLS